jgi:branched-chain amino acid transport system substrate-binding protein
MHVRRRARIRARWSTILVGTALATLLGGCAASGSSSVKVSGKTLTIYASAPVGGGQAGQDVLAAEQLAFNEHRSEVTAFGLAFKQLTAAKLSDRGRTAIQDTTAIAYLGELAPGASADTLGITNAQDLLQVSPMDTAVELTQATSAVPGAPGRYYESLKTYGRTFARVVPSTAAEARAQIQEMQALSVKQLYVADDGSPYGAAVALAVKHAASGAAITVTSSASGADAVFYGASDVAAAVREFKTAAQSNPNVKLFGPSALDTETLAAGLSPGTHNVYISSPGFLTKDLSPAAKTFVDAFTAQYNRAPAPQAIFGYEAMLAVLDSIKKAGASANNRSTVVQNFFSIKNRDSVLGTYSINVNGDTNLAPFIFSRLRGGSLSPFTFVQVQG